MAGECLADLGFRNGQIIDRAVFERRHGHFLDPRDPSGQARLGRMPQQFRAASEIYAVLVALEPEASSRSGCLVTSQSPQEGTSTWRSW
jgi:hypothetical protein